MLSATQNSFFKNLGFGRFLKKAPNGVWAVLHTAGISAL